MRSAATLVASVALCVASASAEPGATDPYGHWRRQDGMTRIDIAPCDGRICAVDTWVRNPGGSEHVGDTLVMTLHEATPTVLVGKAYDERRHRTYSMRLTFGPPGLHTRGCVFLGILCRSAAWTRVPEG